MRLSVPPLLCGRRAHIRVAISRARDPAELLTDDAWKLADRVERTTGKRRWCWRSTRSAVRASTRYKWRRRSA